MRDNDKKTCKDNCVLSEKFDIMFDRIQDIHKSIHGNGNPGLKTKQAVIAAKVNLCLWVLGIFLATTIGITVKNGLQKPKAEKPRVEKHGVTNLYNTTISNSIQSLLAKKDD